MGTTRNPEFICDAMLGGLAKWLRAAGYSAEFNVEIENGELIREALEKGKIVVTSDSGIRERYAVERELVSMVFVPTGLTPLAQLALVLGKLALPLGDTRCMECNGELKEVPLEEVKAEVPPKVRKLCERFFLCQICGKVFWHGTHWQSISRRLRQARELANNRYGGL